jgi:hypothetical protein
MINIKEILTSFTEEKQQEFISFLDKKNKRKDAKNIQLTKFLISDDLSLKEICFALYQTENKVAYHALRKRLFQSIIDFTASTNLKEENSTDIQLIKLILSARTFLQKKQYSVGYKILNKAEVIAKEHQLFAILNEIYHSKIQFAYTRESINMNDLIKDFKENQKQYLLEEELNIAYARIKNTLNEVNHQNKVIDVKEMIQYVLEEHGITISSSFSFKSLYQLIQITTISSSQNLEYWNVEPFLIETYQVLKNHKSKEKQLFYHIEILYQISNTLFRNKKFTESFKYLELMHFYMRENNNKHLKEFNLKYHLLLALNYNYTGNQDLAIEILTPFTVKKDVDIVSQLDIHLSLIVFHFQQKGFKNAQSLFSKFYHTDKWYIDKIGIEWTVQKSLIEILLQIDLGNIDIVDSRMLSFKRNYFKHLKNLKQERVINYVKLVEMYYKSPEAIASNEFLGKVKNSFEWIDNQKEDIFMMSFFAWLKAKMTKQDVYLVTLDLVNS